MPEVSIIIVTHNAAKIIKDCLVSLVNQDFQDYEVIIIDNDSSDGTKQYIKENFPQFILVENKKNLGFCKANNQGIRLAKAEYIFCLNSDVILESDFLLKILERARSLPPDFGMFSPKILKMDRKTIDSTGLILTKVRRFYDRGAGRKDFGQYDKSRKIFGPCAASALYKKRMLDEIKLNDEYFDDDFFFLVEDIDLAWRANRFGWRGYFIPEAKCYHQRNSSQTPKKIRQYLSFRNRYFLLIKNESTKNFFKNFLCFLVYDTSRFFYLAFKNSLTLKAMFDIIYLWQKMYGKRKLINKKLNLRKRPVRFLHFYN